MSQTRKHSLLEAILNTGSAYVLSLCVAMWLYPYFGFPVTFAQANGITMIFTALSLVRNYVVRRIGVWLQGR